MKIVAAAIAALLTFSPAGADEAPTEVMIVGTFHMSNPGRDLYNVAVDDVLAERRQSEIAAAVKGLAGFSPTIVAVEWPADVTDERYAAYRKNKLEPSRNEVVQLGFRLAKLQKLARVYGVDVEGDFPYGAVESYAKAHGQSAILEKAGADIGAMVARQEELLSTTSVSRVLRWLNDPAEIAKGNGFYRTTLRIGGGEEQPGAELLTAWYRRNFLICANLVQLTKPGDRMVVLYGSGHSFLLRQCVAETPGLRLVEPNDYLPDE